MTAHPRAVYVRAQVARALDLLGERWTLLVVRELLAGSAVRRYPERTMLAQR